jgi:hypothetical protein
MPHGVHTRARGSWAILSDCCHCCGWDRFGKLFVARTMKLKNILNDNWRRGVMAGKSDLLIGNKPS